MWKNDTISLQLLYSPESLHCILCNSCHKIESCDLPWWYTLFRLFPKWLECSFPVSHIPRASHTQHTFPTSLYASLPSKANVTKVWAASRNEECRLTWDASDRILQHGHQHPEHYRGTYEPRVDSKMLIMCVHVHDASALHRDTRHYH